jgi:predicted unusual protein kinase regulating ubiquinone biosynthesis (AarF/ABC1/UbiB family)
LFFNQYFQHGPFISSLTDLHPSNILVDKDWHITSLVDFEYAFPLPIKMIHPPHWFTTLAVDRIVPEGYNQQRLEFMTILTAEEEYCVITGLIGESVSS